jgi:hypothetical protein
MGLDLAMTVVAKQGPLTGNPVFRELAILAIFAWPSAQLADVTQAVGSRETSIVVPAAPANFRSLFDAD